MFDILSQLSIILVAIGAVCVVLFVGLALLILWHIVFWAGVDMFDHYFPPKRGATYRRK